MMKYVVCGNSVEDVANGVEAMKRAIAGGATCGVGGSALAEVEQGLAEMRSYLEMRNNVAEVEERLNAIQCNCLHPSCDCPCPYCECKDEDENLYEEGYMVSYRNGDYISYNVCGTPEEAMQFALAEGYGLDEIDIYHVRAYDEDDIQILERVYSK